jgi:tetratricopeptide (TPR) repeat protein
VRRTLATGVPILLLAAAAGAGAVWYVWPQAGMWPFVACAALWIVGGLLTRRWWTTTPYDIPLALFLLAAYVGVWVAFDRDAAWAKYWMIVGGVMLFYAVAHLPTERHQRAFGWLYALFGAGIAGYFFWTNDWDAIPAKIEVFNAWGKAIQARLPYLPGHRMHPNVVGGMLAAILPFQVWALASGSQRRWFSCLAGAAALGLSGAALIMTTSRGAWLGLAVAGGLWGLWAVSRLLSTRGAGPWGVLLRRLTWVVALLVLVSVVGAGAVLVLAGPDTLSASLAGVVDAGDRAALLEHAAWLMQDYVYTGGGLGSFQLLHSTYVLVLHVGHSVHSHNLFLDIGVEQGVIGLLAFLALVGVAGAQILRDRLQCGLLAAAAVSLGVVLVHGLVEDALYGSRGVLLLFLPLALLWARQPYPNPWSSRWRWAVGPGSVILVALGLLVWGRSLWAAGWANAGAVAQSRAELSIYHFPGQTPREVRTRVDLDQAVLSFERALALEPGSRTANLRLGMIRYEQGEYEAALQLLQRAYAANPHHLATQELLGYAYVATGQPEMAAPLLAHVSLGARGVDKLLWEARSFRERGEEVRAADAYRAALLIEPGNATARQGLEQVAP